jgi:hypothetical protein
VANKVLHVQLDIEIDLNKSVEQTLWDRLYAEDRENAKRHVPVSQRGLMCAGVCKDEGVTAWMYLRERNGGREAVHERAEDEARHAAPMSDEHKAYQERIVRVAQAEGFQADCEVRTRTGERAWIRTDTMVAYEGHRIGWEIQLSTIERKGPKSVRARAAKATANNITPAWHTDRPNYSQRNDAHWTACNHFNAPEIRTNPIRIVSGFRALDFWHCEAGATLLCPDNITDARKRCGDVHLTPKPRDILFDDMVRNTATGLVVPVKHRMGRRVHRFWVTRDDQRRLYDFVGGPGPEDQSSGADKAVGASVGAPTCRPQASVAIPKTAPVDGSRPSWPAPASSGPVLDWRAAHHWSGEALPCRYCSKPTPLRGGDGRPAHKVCAEAAGV